MDRVYCEKCGTELVYGNHLIPTCVADETRALKLQIEDLKTKIPPGVLATLDHAAHRADVAERQIEDMRHFIMHDAPECPGDADCTCLRCRFTQKPNYVTHAGGSYATKDTCNCDTDAPCEIHAKKRTQEPPTIKDLGHIEFKDGMEA